MSDLYYKGDLGDLGNVDWFFASNHHHLPDVIKVTIKSNGPQELWAEIEYGNGHHIASGTIVPNPSQHKHVGCKSGWPSVSAKQGDIVWFAKPGAEWEKCRVIGVGTMTVRLIRLVDSFSFDANYQHITHVDPATQTNTVPTRQLTATSGCSECGAKPGEQHADDCQFLKDMGCLAEPEPKKSEGERLADFFRGNDTW